MFFVTDSPLIEIVSQLITLQEYIKLVQPGLHQLVGQLVLLLHQQAGQLGPHLHQAPKIVRLQIYEYMLLVLGDPGTASIKDRKRYYKRT